jgi:hypothetical protein
MVVQHESGDGIVDAARGDGQRADVGDHARRSGARVAGQQVEGKIRRNARAPAAASAELTAPVPAPASSTMRPASGWRLNATSLAAIGP